MSVCYIVGLRLGLVLLFGLVRVPFAPMAGFVWSMALLLGGFFVPLLLVRMEIPRIESPHVLLVVREDRFPAK